MIVDAILMVLATSFALAAYWRGLAWTALTATISICLVLVETFLCLTISKTAASLGITADRNAGYETLWIICFVPTCVLLAITWATKLTTVRRRLRPHLPDPHPHATCETTVTADDYLPTSPASSRDTSLPSRLGGALAAGPSVIALLIVCTTVTSHTLQGTLSASPVQSHVLNWGHQIVPRQVRDVTLGVLPAAPPAGPATPVVAVRAGRADGGPQYSVSPKLLELISQYRSSIVKVTGYAPKCGSALTASGFVIAPGRVLTNAHAVAAVTRTAVQPGGTGPRYKSRVIHFDPASDLAVLHVPHLKADPLPLARVSAPGDQAAIVGYPRGGGMTISPGKVSRKQHLWSTNIVTKREALRQALVLDADVKPGNSGGPVLDQQGQVSAIVFARDRNHEQVAFASDVQQWRSLLNAPEEQNPGHESAPCPDHVDSRS